MVGDWIRFGIGIFLITTVYFAPMGIAVIRRHNNLVSLSLVNFLLGWTVIFWVVAILWSMSKNASETRSLGEILNLK